MLPAIVFIFSRAGCDQAAKEVHASADGRLLDLEETKTVADRVDAFRAAHPDLPMDEERIKLVRGGVASHHAGMLPLEKALVEGLFQDGLIKAVFATHNETATGVTSNVAAIRTALDIN